MQLTRGIQALVIGLGSSGLSVVRHLLGCGLQVSVSEGRPQAALDSKVLDFLTGAGVQLECGGHSETLLAGADLVIPSPGVPLDLPLLQAARRAGLPIAGELALAAGRFTVPVVAVTGSNGKTTVTGLIGELLRAAGKRPFVGGNIGTPLLDFFAKAESYDCAVLELSSFQLDLAGSFRPDIGLLLNISPDHLDRHGSLAAYTEAKLQLFAHQRAGDYAILGADDPALADLALPTGVARCRFGFGPQCEVQLVEGQVRLHDAAGQMRAHYDLRQTRLHSRVNQLNAAAAIAAAVHCGAAAADIRAGLTSFTPPAHRMAEVAMINGVRFIDDSKATNIGALQAALGSCEGPVLLIAGGRDKGGDYGLLREIVAERVKYLLLLGEAADLMAAALSSVTTTEKVSDMAEAVQRAIAQAAAGDVVLLAPGCSSFDMFSGYAERGRVFAECVQRLATAAATCPAKEAPCA